MVTELTVSPSLCLDTIARYLKIEAANGEIRTIFSSLKNILMSTGINDKLNLSVYNHVLSCTSI